jgi:hypothetical protein
MELAERKILTYDNDNGGTDHSHDVCTDIDMVIDNRWTPATTMMPCKVWNEVVVFSIVYN